MTTIISKSTIESSAYDNVVSFLDTRTIIRDPKDSAAGTLHREFIYDSDPLLKSLDFGGFPYIVAEFPTLEYSKTSANGKVKHLTWSMLITVRTAKDGNGNGTSGVGKTDMFTICDDLQELFNSSTHRQSFQNLNMFMMNLTKNNNDTLSLSQKLIYESSYTLTFETRMVIST